MIIKIALSKATGHFVMYESFNSLDYIIYAIFE